MKRQTVQDFKVGETFLRKLAITEDLMSAFASISGDVHPLHVNEDFARARGFKGRVAYGNVLGLMVSSVVGMDLESPNALLISQRLNYRAPFFIGDEITLSAKTDNVSEGVSVVDLELSFANQGGAIVANGKCQVKILS